MLQTLREKQIGKKKKKQRIEKINTARHEVFFTPSGTELDELSLCLQQQCWFRCSVLHLLPRSYMSGHNFVFTYIQPALGMHGPVDGGETPIVTCSCEIAVLRWLRGVQQAVLKTRPFFLALVKS